MPVEVATSIAQLDETNPLPGDDVQEGDDHTRLIKDVLKTQFPGSGGVGFSTPITASEAELNYSVGVTSAIQPQIDANASDIAAVVGEVPVGGIIMYSGLFSAIPANYHLCDGLVGTPDLTDKFIYGTNTEGELENTGGSADAVAVDHNHTFTGDLLPTHQHTLATHGDSGVGFVDSAGQAAESSVSTSAVSGGTPSGTVNNSGVAGTDKNIPPYTKLAFIMRIS